MPASSIRRARSGAGRAKAAGSGTASTKKPALLAGGNPQIPKGDGDAPVQAYIAAMPGWKRGVERRLDALVARTSPAVIDGRRGEAGGNACRRVPSSL
jgi:hypothetical protein